MKHEKQTTQVHASLRGVLYPARKSEIIQYARDKGVSTEVMDMFGQLPGRYFHNESDVLQALHLTSHQPMHDIKIQERLGIPHGLPRFDEEPALLIVTGRQEGIAYRAYQAAIVRLVSHKVPRPHYSDREGHYRVTPKTGLLSSDSSRETHDDTITQEFISEFRRMLQSTLNPGHYEKIYIFAPAYVKRYILSELPWSFRKRLSRLFDGNYIKQSPLVLLEKIADTEAGRTNPANPVAQRILATASQARLVIRGKP